MTDDMNATTTKEEVRSPETCPVPTVARHGWRKSAPGMLRCSVARLGTVRLARDRMATIAAEGVDDPAVIKNRLEYLDMLVASWDGAKPSKKRWELTDADEELLRRCEESMVEHKEKNPNAKFSLKTQMSVARYMLGVVRHGRNGCCGVGEVAEFAGLTKYAAKVYVDRVCRWWRPEPKGGKIRKKWNQPVYPLLAMTAYHVAGKKTRRWRVVER